MCAESADVMIVTDIARSGTSSRGIIAKPHLTTVTAARMPHRTLMRTLSNN